MTKMTPVQLNQFILNRAIMVFHSIEDLQENVDRIAFKLNDIVLIKSESGIEYRILEETNRNGVVQVIEDEESSTTTAYWNLFGFNTSFVVQNEAELTAMTDKVNGDVVFCLGKNKAGDGYHSLRVKSEGQFGDGSIPSSDGGYWNVVPNSTSGGGGGEITGDFLSYEDTMAIINKYKNDANI